MAVRTPLYHESVRAASWFTLALRLLAITPLIGAWGVLRDPHTSLGERLMATLLMAVISIVLFVFVPWCMRLEIEVDAQQVRFRFGPFGRTLDASAVRAVNVEPYRVWTFGGWGWRFGYRAGAITQAYSVPFLRTGVRLVMANGRAYYVSSEQPDRLADAIRGVQYQ